MVGTAARRRVSSLMAPSCMGTLRSTRTRTFLPVRSAGRSSRVLKLVTALPTPTPSHSPQLRHRAGRIDHAVREAPFIVVPAEDPDQLAFEHCRLEAVDGRAHRVVVEVDRDQRLVGEGEDSLQRPAFARSLESAVDLLNA